MLVDDDSPNIYTIPVGCCDIQTSVDESKYDEIHQNALISEVNLSQKRN